LKLAPATRFSAVSRNQRVKRQILDNLIGATLR
jgi:hypothetical protein